MVFSYLMQEKFKREREKKLKRVLIYRLVLLKIIAQEILHSILILKDKTMKTMRILKMVVLTYKY